MHFLELLKAGLELDPRMVRFNHLEEAIKSDAEIASISKKMQDAGDALSEARSHYGEKSKEAVEAQKKLVAIKTKLSEIPLVSEYDACYREISGIYLHINDLLFGEFNKEIRLGGNHD